ncbi:MAG: choline dehydrogenase-like flavoprotein, partial [Bradymonadia bacterium]
HGDAKPSVNAGKRHHPDIETFADYNSEITEHCDFLVIGSGPGGAICARQLAKAGKRVIVVEAGPIAEPKSFTNDPMDVFNRYYWDSGLRTTRGNVVLPTLHPRALGGGSVFNSAICLRVPEFQLRRWAKEHGIEGLSTEALTPHWEEIEELLRIAPTPPEVQGKRNALFKKGADEMGISAESIHRNVTGCKGSARCVVGCPNNAKNSTDFTVVDDIIEHGGRVMTSIFCDKLIMRGDKASGMTGWVLDPTDGKKSHKVRITAGVVVVAAGCMHTPVILQRSGIKNKLIGQNFRVHPGIFTLGEYDEEIMPWEGATQGFHSLEYLEDGIKLETLWVSPALIAAKFPGLGERYKTHLSNYKNVAVFDGWVSGDDSVGRVRALPGGGKDVTWNLGGGDVRRMKEATALTAELLFASGAHTVYTGISGEFFTLYDEEDVKGLREAELTAQDFTTGSQHLFGTTPMGADRDRHVVDSDGAVYGIDNLYVCDTSIFPISPGVNPMHPLMGIANMLGQRMAEKHG